MTLFQKWIGGWAGLIDGIITILSFGLLYTKLELKFYSWVLISKAK